MTVISFEVEKLSAGHKKVADFIYKNITSIAFLTEKDISSQCGVSVATVSRFWGAVGYDNFKQFKQQLKQETETTPAVKMKDKMGKVSSNDVLDEIIQLEIDHLAETLATISREDFKKAVKRISTAKRIFLYGSGASYALAELLRFRLNRFGLNVQLIEKGGWEIFEHIPHIEQDDVVIVFGFANAPPEVKLLLDMTKRIGCCSILFTDMMVSELVEEAEIVLYSYRGALSEFHSLVVPTAIIDTLTIAIAKQDQGNKINKLQQLYELRKQHAPKLQY
ncbi:MurR/RpiR family transcriptional regulator [Aquibacillus kalidii]|uniref:MurR/RpiR family transcriptional regulator n=1 Tax=Aquibacillus kalidii TaxID=2762597 RepID=UPI001647EA94|nr:MurR/RpiR family transcriptional regulator [Aquibacillus kalidii]